ncbi:MAG: sigma-54-dependent Fis family transcriptional regulator, partial [Candidatus Tectomicrobia bacterium]|nr:sigma-54-dependent Fis family transcriptional regulator [Candidatus Tectomicrobia bacterium]
MSERILVVDDDQANRDVLTEILVEEGYEVVEAEDGLQAMERLKEDLFQLVLTDLRMPQASGIEVLKRMKELDPDAIGIVFTGFGSIESAVEAMKVGAYDYIAKPFNLEEIKIVVRRALDYRHLRDENVSLKRQLKSRYKFENFVGDSEPMQRVFRLIEKIADSDSTVLIYGESGTGKELVARAIHFNSRRQDKPMVPVNCGAIPEDLLESELFGHEKGSFTGATSTRLGRFELADKGTIFLDEIAEMSPRLQVKVLRVLQEQEFERVGGVRTLKVNVRVIAATNQDLEKAVAAKLFREDLYYRLNVIPVPLPPLRERKSDIPLLIRHFLEHFRQTRGHEITGISPGAMELFMSYHWPGNVRELENLMQRVVILKGKGLVLPEDLPEKFQKQKGSFILPRIELPPEGVCLKSLVETFEKELIQQALEKAQG